MQEKSLVIVMMSIERRKSLLFMLSTTCQLEESSIVIVSLIALRQNLKRRCEKMSIRCVEWNSQKSFDAASIVLMTSKFAIRDEFRTFINRLRTTQRLNRIVIDECHVMLNDQWNFRKKMQQLRDLITAASSMILLTTTLFSSKEAKLWVRMHF